MAARDGSGGGSADHSTPTARRMIVGGQLRRLREDAGISRSDAGYQIRASDSKISRLELGRVGFKERDVADLLTMYGLSETDERRAVLLHMVKEANQPGWWQKYNDFMPRWFEPFLGLEEAASRIQTYELQFVPGLLQTEDYARAVITHGLPDAASADAEGRVALRMRRQRMLHRPQPPRLWAVLDESVIHRPIGGRAVYRAQLESLLDHTAMPHVTVQVVPYDRSGYAAEGAFTLLRFVEAELPSIGYVDHIAGGFSLEKPEEIELVGRALDRLAVDAETPERSRQMIAKLLAES
ncbi:helix-turn-helix domain-containing protein [Saccharomonospora piscinae]|uniref:helix-turn-helix domain-containing protein n=1 Tax=Saccharomonospora piscinae TaxID=687388 RepID=UPI0004630B0A|nr:helix-turn-helix transcriptional regulator [Saccharomonospora piscinae]